MPWHLRIITIFAAGILVCGVVVWIECSVLDADSKRDINAAKRVMTEIVPGRSGFSGILYSVGYSKVVDIEITGFIESEEQRDLLRTRIVEQLTVPDNFALRWRLKIGNSKELMKRPNTITRACTEPSGTKSSRTVDHG